MTRLNVVDLDQTLIPFDSLRTFILRNLNLRVAALLLQRKLGRLSRTEFAARIARHLASVLDDGAAMDRLADTLAAQRDPEVVAQLEAASDAQTVNALVSASPEAYVSRVAARMGLVGLGSHWRGGEYFHCYGPNKLVYLRERYPPDAFTYHFAISDSDSDAELLALFEVGVLWTPHV